MPVFTADRSTVNPTSDDYDVDYSETFVPSDADLEWAAEVLNADAPDYDVEDDGFDEDDALEAAAMDLIERCLIPHDVADYISRTSLVGHPA